MPDLIKDRFLSVVRMKKKKFKNCELCPDFLDLRMLRDIVMFLCEEGIRGMITQPVKYYVKANKYITDQHNPDETSTYLQ